LKFKIGVKTVLAEYIRKPTTIPSAGNKPKIIEEFFGLVNTQTSDVSIARMKSPPGWEEPVQTPEFDEYTLVLRGMVRVRLNGDCIDVSAGEACLAKRGEWVQYSTPDPEGAEYISVCLPAFSPETVHRDAE
jgi:mannose-6-phosphate isomerase-like protein (cupin superfamily)